MANPMTPSQMLNALRAEGLKPQEYPGWKTHNRNHKGKWGDVNGIVIHHTAGVGSGMLRLCHDGTSALPGPLCHAFLSKAAVLHLVGNGRANHAGTFAENAHDAVVREAAVHPRPDASEPVDGNQHYYGIEIENRGDGKDPYPAAQYDAAVRWAAAICRHHGWSQNSIIGHSEGTRRKIDPSFSMQRFRDDVAKRLKPPVAKPAPAPVVPAAQTSGSARMDYGSFARTTAMSVPAGTDRRIYFDTEYADGAGDHTDGSKTFLVGAHYTATVNILTADPLPEGVYIRFVREKSPWNDTVLIGEPAADLVPGLRRYEHTGTGVVAADERLQVEIVNTSNTGVSVTWAGLRALSQAI